MSEMEEYSKSNKKILELAQKKLNEMRNAKQIFEEELSGEPLTQRTIIEAIKIAQIEAIEETVKLCSEKSKSEGYINWVDPWDYTKGFNGIKHWVDEESILNCAEILRKKINEI